MMFGLVLSLVLATCLCYARAGLDIGGFSASSLLGNVSSSLSDTPQLANSSALQESVVVISSLTAVDEENKGWYRLAFWILAIVTVLTTIFLILARKKVIQTAAIVKEASKAFSAMPGLFFSP